MKNNFLNPVKFGLLLTSFILVCGFASATNYTAVVSGNWSSTTTWGGSAPPFNITSADQVNIGVGVNVTMDQNVTLNNALASINVIGTLSSAAHVQLDVVSGMLTGNGNISAAQVILDAAGSLTFTGAITADTLMNSIVSLSSAAQILVNNELTLSTLTSITTGGTLTLGAGSDITINGGSLALSGGTLNLTSAYNVNYSNMSATTGLELSGSGLGKVTLNVGSMNNVTLSTNLTTNDSLKFVSGTLILNGWNLTANAMVSGTVMIAGSSSSNLRINTSGGLSSSIMFPAGFQNLNTLTINVGSGNSVNIGSALTVHGNLDIMGSSKLDISNEMLTVNGNVTGTGWLAMNAGSDLVLNTSNSITGNINITGTAGNFTVNTGSGNAVKLGAALNVDTLNLTSGILVLNGNNVSITGDISAGGTGVILSTSMSNISVTAATNVNGYLTFDLPSDTVNNLTVNVAANGSLTLGSNMVINGNLNLMNGYLDIWGNNLNIGASGSITGAGANAYVITSLGGNLTMYVNTSSSTTFAVGTSNNYFPAEITLNPSSATGTIGVNVSSGVYSQGTTGVEISTSQPMVNATWLFQNNISSGLNTNMNLYWQASAEVNGFVHTDDYISHYESLWDDIGDSMTAMTSGSLYFTTRANITSMSPFAVFDQKSVTTGVDELAQASGDIIIYPNPANQNLYIKNTFGTTNLINAEVYNTLGQMISSYQFKDDVFTIPVDRLTPGTYLIKFFNGDMEMVKKFSKL
jgi:hypothetical protein